MSEPESNSDQISPKILETAIELWRQSGTEHYISVRGTSMLPFLRDGDQVLVEHNLSNLRRGDIVVFQNDSELITHRVLQVRPEANEGITVLTKGDNRLRPDPLVNGEDIVGRVRAVRRGVREMPLDTRSWRWSNWLIGNLMVAWAKIYRIGLPAKGRLNAEQSTFASRVLRRMAFAINSILIRGMGLFSGRWKT